MIDIEIPEDWESPKSDIAYEFDDGMIIRMDELTCYKCECRCECEYVDDPYNTDGDCLAMK